MRCPVDTRHHPMLNYAGKLKMVEEARENNPYEQPKDLGIDYRFWNGFHSNFYELQLQEIQGYQDAVC